MTKKKLEKEKRQSKLREITDREREEMEKVMEMETVGKIKQKEEIIGRIKDRDYIQPKLKRQQYT